MDNSLSISVDWSLAGWHPIRPCGISVTVGTKPRVGYRGADSTDHPKKDLNRLSYHSSILPKNCWNYSGIQWNSSIFPGKSMKISLVQDAALATAMTAIRPGVP